MSETASKSVSTLKEIVAGSVGGVVQVLVGQPFDTIKVRLQSQPAGSPLYTGTWDCVTKTARQEGLGAFYKGTFSPLVGIAFCVSIQFGVLESMKRQFLDNNQGSPLTLAQLYVAGGVAGVANSIVSGPVEHIRTRMQVQTKSLDSSAATGRYSSTLDCFRTIRRQYGWAGVYKGQVVTMLREWQGYGGYFLAYEFLVQQATTRTGKRVSELPLWQVMSFGAAAGYAMWIPVFPLDSVKSRIQTDSLDPAKRKYHGWLDCLKKVVKHEGVGGLYKGFLPCLLRAAPVNAATFVAYEFAMNAMGRR